MSFRIKNILLSIAALLLGVLLYVLFRPTTVVSLLFGRIWWVSELQTELQSVPADFLRYYLPDLLWAFSLSCGLHAVILPDQRETLACGGLAVICGIVWELLQKFNAVQGTGDWVDVVMYFLAAIASILINQRR